MSIKDPYHAAYQVCQVKSGGEGMNLVVSPPPFIKKEKTTQKVIWSVIFALLPPVVAAAYLFGVSELSVILSSVVSCLLTEAAVQKYSGKKVTIDDGTAIITGLILGLLLPYNAPIWLPFIGGIFAIGIVKQAFGGHGYNIFNPAIAAWVFLMMSWATKTLTPPVLIDLQSFFLNYQAVRLVESSPAFVLLGGLFLFFSRTIKLGVPIGFLSTVFILSLIFGLPLSRAYTGIFILVLFFVITDPVTSPITKDGRLIFGAGCGLLSVLYSFFANFEEGLGLSVLLMNALVPLIDRYTKPSPILLEGMNV
jgi:electron transport complex protein RnfD